jgi:hypothetical protein
MILCSNPPPPPRGFVTGPGKLLTALGIHGLSQDPGLLTVLPGLGWDSESLVSSKSPGLGDLGSSLGDCL